MWICEKDGHCVDSCEGCEHYVEMVEVKRGQNLRDGGIFECSLCGWMDWDTMLADGRFNFCPNCGARMEVDHETD